MSDTTLREQASERLTDEVLRRVGREWYASRPLQYDSMLTAILAALQPLFDQVEREKADVLAYGLKVNAALGETERERDDLRAKLTQAEQSLSWHTRAAAVRYQHEADNRTKAALVDALLAVEPLVCALVERTASDDADELTVAEAVGAIHVAFQRAALDRSVTP
jgi:hypothetical protein